MNKTPYEIRLELLKMAKEMLEFDYFTVKDALFQEWNVNVTQAQQNQAKIPSLPELPKFPTAQDVIDKARILNTFVSNS